MSTESQDVPDPVFLEHLEWQLCTELRREARFAPRTTASPIWKRVRTAALIAASLVLGGATVVAAERVQQSREAEILAAKAQVRIELQHTRAQFALKRRDEAAARAQAGVATQTEVERADLAQMLETLELRRVELDLTELERSGREPRSELDAPLVSGEDFVSERLQLELLGARARLAEQERAVQWLQRMVERGFAAGSELERARGDAQSCQQQVGAVEELLELRRGFVSGDVARERVWVLAERARTSAALITLRGRVEIARGAVARLEAQASAGVASGTEVDEARQGLLVLDAERQLLVLELERLDARLPR